MGGLFISLEGPDGSGKSTQTEYLREYFQELSLDCIFTREPGGTEIGEKTRQIILDRENSKMADMTEALLYAASRAQHVEEKILPALEAGKVVVCDRYVDSSIAYQGYGRHMGKQIEEINSYAICGCIPDLTILISVNPRVGRKRIAAGERDRLESEKLKFHQDVYQGYLELAEREPDRIKVVDGTRDREAIRDEIRQYVEQVLRSKGLLK